MLPNHWFCKAGRVADEEVYNNIANRDTDTFTASFIQSLVSSAAFGVMLTPLTPETVMIRGRLN